MGEWRAPAGLMSKSEERQAALAKIQEEACTNQSLYWSVSHESRIPVWMQLVYYWVLYRLLRRTPF